MTDKQGQNLPSPCYVVYEDKLRSNLALIKSVADETGAEFILAFKAFALWKTFPIFKEYISHTTASSPWEALLAKKEFGSYAHTYSPAYEDETFDTIMDCSSHITFNSIRQFNHFYPQTQGCGRHISCGIRINPEYSEIETELYNPCAKGSRFGVTSAELQANGLPQGIEGFHCHCHCESDSLALQHTLQHIEAKFGHWLTQLKWLNLGGGHLLTRKGYDVDLLKSILKQINNKYPNLHLILEPGSAFAWQTGVLTSKVVDIVENAGIKTAILNVSFTCHMPDCLEMPYHPKVVGATTLPDLTPEEASNSHNIYRLGGNSCLSGDFMGYWKFDSPLEIGQEIVFEDMIHYTTVKTNTFNGIAHPSIGIMGCDGKFTLLRKFEYEDYKNRMC